MGWGLVGLPGWAVFVWGGFVGWWFFGGLWYFWWYLLAIDEFSVFSVVLLWLLDCSDVFGFGLLCCC